MTAAPAPSLSQSSASKAALPDGTYPTTCWECSTNCGALATVQDGRVVKYAPNKANPHSKGAFCIKGIRGAPDLTYNPRRLLYPQRRVGARGSGEWQQISWDDALDEMAERFAAVREKFGAEAIVGATSGANFSRSLMVALMMRSIGSPNWMINQDLCGGCRAVSDKITGLGIGRGEDIDNAKCLLIVGRNSYAADPIEWTKIKAAKARGAKIIVIDPKRIPAVDLADIWLAPRIGTDAALALAMIDILIKDGLYDREFVDAHCHGFEELKARAAEFSPQRAADITGLAADDIVAAARLYGDGPSTFVSGHGIDASSVGVQTFRAFHAMVAISGNLDRKGGNLRSRQPQGFSNYIEVLHRPEFRLSAATEARTLGADQYPLWAGARGWQTACHNPTVINAMLTDKPYPVRAAYVSGVNIAVTYPDTQRTIEALKSLDYLVVATHDMNPTAQWADLVLPKTTTLEEEEVSFMPSAHAVLFTQAVVSPVGEAREEIDIAVPLLDRLEKRAALTKRFLPWRSQREFNTFLLGDTGITIQELEERGYHQVATGTQQAKPIPTKTGKFELYSTALESIGEDPLPCFVSPPRDDRGQDIRKRFPFTLITGDREKSYHHSRFRDQAWAQKVSPDPRLVMHPSTAAELSLEDESWVRLEVEGTGRSCQLRLKLSETTPPDVVSTGMGWWRPEGATDGTMGAIEININAALSYEGPFDPVTGSSAIRGQLCRVEAID